MPEPEALGLLDVVNLEVLVVRVHELAHQLAHVADHQHRAPHPEGHQVVQDVGEDGFSGDVEQHLGLGVRVGAQPGAHARGRDDRDRLTRHAYVPGPRGDA